MKKIVKANGAEVVIFDEVTNEYSKLQPSDFDFVPQVGDLVEVHQFDDEVIINKIKALSSEDKININIVNENKNENNSVNQNTNTNVNTLVDAFVSQGTGKRVNKWVYVALAILLGSIGAHHFYAGDTRRGVWYLLLSWTMIPALFGFFQGLSAALKPADEFGMITV